MLPFVHKLTWPKEMAAQFSKGSIAKYNAYAISYCRANNPNMQLVTINGQPQDPFSQGYILAVYKHGSNPGDMAEQRKENKTKKGAKK